jgi:hypothetical protein
MSRPSNEELKDYAYDNPDMNGTWLDSAVKTANWAMDKVIEGMIQSDKATLIPDESECQMCEELKPCPCGKTARYIQCAFGKWSVHCGGVDECFMLEGEFYTQEQASKAWNTRQEPKQLEKKNAK